MKKYIYIFTVCALVLTGCNFLEPDNKTAANQTAESVFSEDPSALRIYAYSLLKKVVTYTSLYEDGTDLYLPANKKTASDYDQYTFNAEDANVKGLYSACYAAINAAHCCMHYDALNEYEAEMRWIRCYCYYVLTQQFGGVPYVTEYINNSNTSYPRENLIDEYDKIIADLTEIAGDANLSADGKDGIVSVAAVNALLAKVNLAAGWDAERAGQDGAKYFTAAVAAAQKLTTGFDLSALSFDSKWSPSNEQNAEVIFAVQYDRAGWKGETKTGGHGLQNTFGSYYGDCTTTGLKYSDSYHCINPKAAYLWDAADARWDGTFMTEMLNSTKGGWGTEGYFAYYNVADHSDLPVAERFFPGTATANTVSAYKSANAARLQKGDCHNDVYVIHYTYPQISVNGAGQAFVTFINSGSTSGMFSAPSVKKFDDPSTECIALNKTNSYRDIVILHMSDLFLVEAEAQLKLGKETEALALVNAVRARSGAAPVASFASYNPAWKALTLYQNFTIQPIDLILDERARELFAEGHRWMDLHRTGQLERYNQTFNYHLNGHAVKTYRPIPQAEINANTALTADDQNPEWK